jgi:hypothetical protein
MTLGALAVHSGIAMGCAASLERRRHRRLSAFGLFAFAVNFCVLIACIWWPGWSHEPVLRATLGTGTLLAYYVLAIPCADLQEQRAYPVVPLLGLVACAAGLLMVLVCIWAESTGDVTFPKATGIVAVIAFSLAHTCLLLRVPGGTRLRWIFGGATACVWGVAAMGSAAILFEPDHELFYRLFGALGVMDASGSLSLLIVAKLKQVGKVEKLASTPAQLEIRCPRCLTSQVLGAGKSKCTVCGLKFVIEIEEPRCPKCDYVLWQLPERRCPECGTAF